MVALRRFVPSGVREIQAADHEPPCGGVNPRARDDNLVPLESMVVVVRNGNTGNTQHRKNCNQPPK
jgi:hypothetical protein